MQPTSYDILRTEKGKAAIWLETSADLTNARRRIKQIISFWPGRYEVVERKSQRIVAAVGRSAELRVRLRRTREYARERFWRSYTWLLAPSPRVADLTCYKELQNYARDCCRTGCEWLFAPIARIQAHRISRVHTNTARRSGSSHRVRRSEGSATLAIQAGGRGNG